MSEPYGTPPSNGGQPGYGAQHPQASTIQLLGIIGIFVPVLCFIAWYMGGQAKKEIEAGAPYPFEGPLKVGYLLGKIFSIISIVSIVLCVAIVGVIIGAADATAGY